MPKNTPKLSKTHAVPQHIAAFEFKLIGDLTLKQFLFAGVGIAVAYAAWISNLSFLVKWSTIILAGGLGLGVAFFPIQDRTLDQWLLSFIAALFSPTQRVWRKEPLAPEYLREDYSQFLTSQVLSLTPLQGRRKLKQYLEGVREGESLSESDEREFIEKLNFDLPVEGVTPTPPPPPIEPPKVEPPPPIKPPPPKVEGTIKVKRDLRPLPERKLPAPPFAKASEGPRPTVKKLVREVKKERRGIQELEKQNVELKNRLEQANRQLKSLTELKEKFAKDERYRARLLEQEKEVHKLVKRQETTQKEISKIKGVKEEKKVSPNLISGTVKDRQGKLLENLVIIIKDQDGDPVRALKTDRLGQFTIATPLENGSYTVEVSGRGESFGIMKVVIDGAVLPPLEFREKYA